MSNKVFKNYQISLGLPVQVKIPLNLQNFKPLNTPEDVEKESGVQQLDEDPEGILEKAREEADLILKEAQLEALKVIEDARKEADKARCIIEEEARQKGYQDGFNEGRSQYEALIQEAELIKANAEAEYAQVLSGIEADAVNMVLDIAKKVIGMELNTNRESILHLISQAFQRCADKDNLILKVAPEDYDFVVENKDRLISMSGGVGDIQIKKDLSLCSGGCIVETAFGSIDASVQTKLRKIKEAFLQVTGSKK